MAGDMRARRREPFGQRPAYHEIINRVIAYVWLGYSVERLSQLFPEVPIKTIARLKHRFG